MKWYVTVHTPSKPDTFCIVDIPVNSKTYAQRISLYWFRNRELGRAFPDNPKPDWVTFHKTVQWCDLDSRERSWDGPADAPVFTDAYKFYEAIGYDRKRQRYTK